jgi:prolyl oligopeptidase
MSRRSRRNGETLLWRFISLSPARRAVFLLSVALVLTTSASFAAESRPNIILLVTDDQRWDAISCAGNPHIRTPNIDALARGGSRFTNMFCTTSICASSRATILTGQYARRHGIWGFREALSDQSFAQTFPAVLRNNGYRTAFIGKWGIGVEKDLPTDQYSHWDGFSGQGRYYDPKQGGKHLTERLGDRAVEFLETTDRDHPFCLHMAFKAAHCQDGADWQFQHSHRYDALYKDVNVPAPSTATPSHFAALPSFLQTSEARRRWQVRFANEAMRQDTVRDYYRLITGVDDVVGRLRAALEKQGLAENTVFIFTSDNGFYLGDHGLAGKWFPHEPSIRLPLVIYDPRRKDVRPTIDEIALTIDLAPTVLQLAGISPPNDMQGDSLLPLLNSPETAWRHDFLYEHLFQHPRIPMSEGVRSERWKYARYHVGASPYEVLFDLKSDPNEEHDLGQSAEHAPVITAFRERLQRLIQQAKGTPVSTDNVTIQYPAARRSDHVDEYHGFAVADPYRWLEDLDSAETRAWVKAQNQITANYLAQIPHRQTIEQRLTELWNYERFGLPVKRGTRYFYTHNNGLQNQSVLYVTESLHGEPRELLDPNTLSKDGTVALAGWRPSRDGKYLAYGIASAGSDWRDWKIMDVATGETMENELKWVKFSGVSWTPDNAGIFYSRYDEPKEGEEFTGSNYFHKLYFHKLGTPQTDDQLIYQRQQEKEWGFDGTVTEDGHYLIIQVWRGTDPKSQLFYKDLQDEDGEVIELVAGFDAEYSFIGNSGTKFWLVTDSDAPKRRVIAIDVTSPEREHWTEVIAESKNVLQSVSLIGQRFVCSYLQDATTVAEVFPLTGGKGMVIQLPGIGSAGGFGGKENDPETFFSFSNYTTPTTIYRYNVQTGERSLFRQPTVGFDPANYTTRQVFYKSLDGTRVPMLISHRKDLHISGEVPTILYGYGGFDISLTPGFSVANLVWMEMGGVYAVANMRGGGEYGRQWHESGMLTNKQNVFDDFIAAAQWLIANGYTTSEKLAVRGGSNGGLLVGAVTCQRPDLFAAAIPAVGVMDMLRFHKFTIGWAWVSEYGSSDDPDQFRYLLGYSPLHNLKPGVSYPATIVTTADHDDRVVPGHSYKYAATLQHCQAGSRPSLIRIETSAGHGAGTPTSKRIAAAADVFAFLVRELDMH